jgi:hypothetical protein
VLAASANDPPAPLRILQAPVPTVGVLPARVTVVNPQVGKSVWLVPAAAVVGFLLNVITTSSVDAVHGLFEIVHLKVYDEPAVPVKVEVRLLASANDPPVPLTMLQAPVPIDGVLPANVTVVKPQVVEPVWSTPAAAAVGFWLNVMTTSSVDVHGLFDIVHLKVYVEPAVPVKVDVGLLASANEPPVPLTMLQAPVPTVGVLPPRVTEVNPHVVEFVWSEPALEVVGFWLNVMTTSSVDVHGLFDIVHLKV